MSSQWLHVTAPPLPAAWSYGDVSCLSYSFNRSLDCCIYRFLSVTFTISSRTSTVIVLSQLDTRYYRDVAGKATWTMDFTLVKEGEKEPLAESAHSEFFLRSVHLEIELEAGTYVVYVRLDRTLDKNEVSLHTSICCLSTGHDSCL